MGLFANTLFSVLMGWMQTAASWLWSLMTNTDVSAWLRWILDNWLVLVILICLAGAAVDFVVYFFRWQPYRIWKNFLRRGKKREDEPAPEAAPQPVFQRTWMYADGTTEVEEVPIPQPVRIKADSGRLDTPILAPRRVVRHASPEQAYHQPVYPPQWQRTTQDEQGESQ